MTDRYRTALKNSIDRVRGLEKVDSTLLKEEVLAILIDEAEKAGEPQQIGPVADVVVAIAGRTSGTLT